MNYRKIYPNIDMEKTGRKMKYMLSKAGYTPRMLKEYLHLSCVQPIYRWYKGRILPSVDHLLMLSELLNVHMEELLVKNNSVCIVCDREIDKMSNAYERLKVYYGKIKKVA